MDKPHRRRSLKADPAAQLALLDLQELDSRADLLRHQRETLPELAEIAALTATRSELDGRRRDFTCSTSASTLVCSPVRSSTAIRASIVSPSVRARPEVSSVSRASSGSERRW